MLDAADAPQPVLTPAAESSSFAPPTYPRPVRHRRVGILGFGRTAKDAPWQDTSWEWIAMNGWWRAAEPDHGVKLPEERYSLWLDMHTLEYTREYGKAAKIEGLQEEWLRQPHPFPILGLEEHPDLPSVRAFPIEALIDRVGRDYFTSTVAYALAWLLAQDDVAEVGLWGIDLTHNTEYADQRPCAEYWIGRLEGAGVKVTIAEGSALLTQRGRYGYEDRTPLAKDLRAFCRTYQATAAQAMEKNKAQMEALRDQLHTDNGAMQAVNSILERLDVWNRGGKVS